MRNVKALKFLGSKTWCIVKILYEKVKSIQKEKFAININFDHFILNRFVSIMSCLYDKSNYSTFIYHFLAKTVKNICYSVNFKAH